jgi:RNA polymerase sigma-70 factor (ECF subfamily)
VALGQLRSVDRDLILLVAWDGLSPSAACSVLGLRPVTARSRLHRARQRLAALLDKHAETAPGPAPTTAAAAAANPQSQEQCDG